MKQLTVDDASLILALQDEIRRSEDSRYDHRLHGVLIVSQGHSARETARLLGDSPRTVQYWVQEFNRNGFAGLSDKQRPGRPSRLSDKQLQDIEEVLRRTPREVGLDVNLWDGKTLSAYIKRKHGVTIGPRQCQKLFRKLGFRLRKPRAFIANRNEEQRRDFKKKAGKTGKAG